MRILHAAAWLAVLGGGLLAMVSLADPQDLLRSEVQRLNGALEGDPANSLSVSGEIVTDAFLAGLPDLPDVKSLTLRATSVTDDGLAFLAKLPKLEVLDLSDSSRLTNGGLRHLERLRGLKQVKITGTAMNRDGASHLSGLPDLRAVYVSDASGWEEVFARAGNAQVKVLAARGGAPLVDKPAPPKPMAPGGLRLISQ